MERKPIIVIVNDFDYIQGGASKVALTTAQILYEKGYNVIFFSVVHKENNYMFKQISVNQKECLHDGVKGAIRGLYNFRSAKNFKNLLDTLDKDNTIIHVHGWTKALSSSIFRVAQKKGFKLVLTIHDYFVSCPNGGYFNYKNCQVCNLKSMSPKCITSNCDSRNYLFKIYRIIRQIIQNKNIKEIKYAIGITDFCIKHNKSKLLKNSVIKIIDNPIDVLKSERIKVEKNKYFIYLGRISKEKGVETFCKAIEHSNYKGIAIGDGNDYKELKEKYKKVKFVGWKNSYEILEILKSARCLVFPSIWYEPAGLTVLEAISYGIPVIVSRETGAEEYVKKYEAGLLFEKNNYKDLIEKMKKCNDKYIENTSKNIYKKYNNNPHSTDKYFNELISFYKSIIND